MSWPESVLIVDDQAEVRRSLIRSLEEVRIRPRMVLEAADAPEAQALWDRHRPDLTLLDIVLSGSSGFDLLWHIRALDPNAIVIIMTAFPQFDYAMEAIRAGGNHFIVKPVTARKLEGALMDVRRLTGSGTDENDRAYYCRLLDRVLRGEESLALLESARRGAGIDDLAGSSMALSLLRCGEPIPPRLWQDAMKGSPVNAVGFLRNDREADAFLAFEPFEHDSVRFLSAAAESLKAPWQMGMSLASRALGLTEQYRRARFALDYAEARGIMRLCLAYETLDIGRYIVSSFHAELMNAYDRGDEEALHETLDGLMIRLRQHRAESAAFSAFRELCDLEGMAPPEEDLPFDETVLRHFQRYLAEHPLPPKKLCLSALRASLLTRQPSASDLERMTHLSYGYLNDLFARQTGKSIRDYRRQLQLLRAAELLSGTELKVYEVAALTGFEGNKHFYGLFQTQFGVTPVQYHEGFFGRKELAE